MDDPERHTLWVQVARGGVAWFRTTGEMPSGSSASGCRLAAKCDLGRAMAILRSEHSWERWRALDELAKALRLALLIAGEKPTDD